MKFYFTGSFFSRNSVVNTRSKVNKGKSNIVYLYKIYGIILSKTPK